MRRVSIILIFVLNCAYFKVYYNTYYNAERYYKQGLQLTKTNPGQAKESFKKAQEKAALVVKRWPNSRWVDDAFYLIAMSYYYQGEYTQALRRCEDFLVHFPKSGYAEGVSFYMGLTLTQLKEYPRALTVFQELVDGSKKYREQALIQIGQTYFLAEDYNEAIKSYKEFIERYPRSRYRNDATLGLANSYFALDDFNNAKGWYSLYLKRAYTSKEKAQVYLKLANCLYNLNEQKGCEACLRDVVGFYPDLDPEASLLLGKSLLAQNKRQEAIAALTRVGSGELGAEAYFLIGKTYEEDKDFTKARAYYDSTRQKSASSDHTILALKRRALLELVGGNKGDTTTTKDPAEAQFHLAEVYLLNLNEPEQALLEYEKVYANYPLSPYAPKALYARAWILENTLKREGFFEIYKEIVNRYPNTEYARKALEALKKYETRESSGSKEEQAR